MRRRAIVAGETFGAWRVIGPAEPSRYKPRVWCECARDLGGCGKRRAVREQNLVEGRTRSCGCLQLELRHRTVGRLRGVAASISEAPQDRLAYSMAWR